MDQEHMGVERRHSLLGVTMAVAAGIVIGSIAVAMIFAVLTAIFHLVGWLLHVAVLAAVVAGIWWLVFGRRRHCHNV